MRETKPTINFQRRPRLELEKQKDRRVFRRDKVDNTRKREEEN